ncbi:sigma-70 family RNA polymerase sigma factor [Phenylobacterium sp.]|uniref:sigma-70 family RNA polymerase sigma factor n=1 Tax=Phenylobacterium sp. TaxID=1871053 RepID=UPI002F3EE721
MSGRVLPFGTLMAAKPDAAKPAFALPFRRPRPGAGRTDETPLDPEEAERFRRLILPHLDGAYSFARFLCRDASLAEDLVQDAFLKAYRGFRGFRGGEPRAWLFAIVRTGHLSSTRRRFEATAEPEALAAVPSGEATPEAALMRQADIDTVREAIDALPEPFRETLVLRELEELSYREIAEITSAPTGTVMSRLARGRALLLAALPSEELGR